MSRKTVTRLPPAGPGHLTAKARRVKTLVAECGFPQALPHMLRHTFITLKFQAGVEPFDISRLVGDDLPTLMKHYAHHRPDHLRHAMDA